LASPLPKTFRTLALMPPIRDSWKQGARPHFIVYYVLHMALQGRPWNDCKGKEKQDLRVRFDALKATKHDKGRTQLEAALDAIGVIKPKA
jgi:hypothetical protein